MDGGDIVLKFELLDGRNADAVLAAESLIAWVRLVQDAAIAIDPLSPIRIELLGRDEGSLKQLLRIIDDGLKSISEGGDEYPYVKKAALGLALALGTAVTGSGVQHIMQPAVQEVRFSPHDEAIFEDMRSRMMKSPDVASRAKDFYKVVSRDRAITGIKIADGDTGQPILEVPMAQFAAFSGLWDGDEAVEQSEAVKTIDARWSVVIIKAAAVGLPRTWRFSRDGVELSARMEDSDFLEAIRERRVPIMLQEGVVMDVAVKYREKLIGQVWRYIPGSRRIVRVISPRPLPGRALPLPFADGPEKH